MSRLIDADEYERRCLFSKDVYENVDEDALYYMLEELSKTPTVDAEPIRHGHWEKVEETNGNYYHYACSKCGELPLNDNLVGEHTQLTPYCPWCGAKMDEKGEEE